MPQCYLSQDFLNSILKTVPQKTIQYADKELTGFFLEYRPSGMGTWYFRYRYGQGKMRYFRIGSTYNMGAVSAREYAYRIRSIVQDGSDPHKEMITAMTSLTVERFIFEKYLPHIQVKKRSWYLDKTVIEKHILPTFGTCLMHGIQSADIVNWQNTLCAQGLQATSCNRILSVLKTLFSSAVQWGLLATAHNPCKSVKALPESPYRVRYLNTQEMQLVINELRSMGNNEKALALQLLICTGARKSEILTARWEYLHMSERILTVPLAKSGKAHHIPLSDEACRIIEKLAKNKRSPWIFPNKSGEKHISSLFFIWDKIRRKLHIPDVRIHDLRHSFASLLVTSGSSLYEVQKILGHHNPKITMRYAHLSQKSLVDVANRIENSLEKGSTIKK